MVNVRLKIITEKKFKTSVLLVGISCVATARFTVPVLPFQDHKPQDKGDVCQWHQRVFEPKIPVFR